MARPSRLIIALLSAFFLCLNIAEAQTVNRAVPTSGSLSSVLTDLNAELAENYKLTPMVLGSVSGTNDYTASVTPTLLSYQDGMSFWIKPPNTNTTAVRVNVDGLGLISVVTAAGATLGSGDFQSTTLYLMRYMQSTNQLRLVTPPGSGFATTDASYLALGASASLTAERVLTAGTCLTFTDAGANSTLTVGVTTDCISTGQIATDGVGAAEIAADAVGSSEIAADAVGTSEIATDGVGAAEIAAGAVGTSEAAALDTGDITTGTFADARVDGTLEADELVLAGDVDGTANANDIDEAAVESELESVIDLADLQGDLPLSTKTSGNYVGTVSAGLGIAVTGADAENATKTVAFDFSDAGASPSLGADECRFTSNATTAGHLVCEGDTADAFESRIAVTDPTADRVMTIPNADSNPIQPSSCGGSDKVTGISSSGVISCGADAGAGGGIANVVEDLTPQLGGGLDLNTFDITGTGNVNVTGDLQASDDVIVGDDLTFATGAVINWNAGDLTLTHSANTLTLTGGSLVVDGAGLTVGASVPLSDSVGTLTLQNVDAIDATTESTIEAAIDTAANLTSIQGQTVTLTGAFVRSGAHSLTLTTTNTTSVTLPTSGTLATTQNITDKPESFCVAASDESTSITTGTNKIRFRMPYAFTLTAVRASVNTAPTGSTIIIDINESGSTLMTTTKLSIDASETTSTTAASAAALTDTALADDSQIGIDFDQVGSSTPGNGVKVCLIGHQ